MQHTPLRWATKLLICSSLSLPFLASAGSPDEDQWINELRASVEQRGETLSAEAEGRLRLKYQEIKATTMRSFERVQQLAQGNGAPLPGRVVPAAPVTIAPEPVVPTAAAAPLESGQPVMRPASSPLAEQLEQLPPGGPSQVVEHKDGFSLNGHRVTDPAGRVTMFAVNPRTGDYTMLVDLSNGQYQIKRGRGNAAAIAVGTAQGSIGNWAMRLADGQAMQADTLVLTSLGIVGIRDSAAFEWVAGQPIKSLTLPAGWSPVTIQRGDVTTTRHLLVERNAESKPKTGSIADLVQTTKRLVGAEAADDYAFWNIDSGQLTTLNISASGKNVTRMSDCRRRNAAVNVCAKAQSYEALWQPDGMRNQAHYYWRAMWWNDNQGPVAATLQDGVKEIRLFDLASGKQSIAFRRPLGLGDLPAKQLPDGQVVIPYKSTAYPNGVDYEVRKLLATGSDMRGQTASGSYFAGQPEQQDAGASPSTTNSDSTGNSSFNSQ